MTVKVKHLIFKYTLQCIKMNDYIQEKDLDAVYIFMLRGTFAEPLEVVLL